MDRARIFRLRAGACGVAVGFFVLLIPSRGFAGINAWTTQGPEGGQTTALAVDPVHPSTIYAGTEGGVFDYQFGRTSPPVPGMPPGSSGASSGLAGLD